jgi:hypothetical protein
MNRFHLSGLTPLSAAAALVLMVSAIAATPAVAQNYPDRQAMTPEQACAGDAQRLCQQFIPDRPTTGACLRRNKRLLSPDCRAFFTVRKLRRHRG